MHSEYFSIYFLFRCCDQRHILRDSRPSTTACPACWAMGTDKLKLNYHTVRKNYFILVRPERPKAEQKSLVPALQAQQINQGRTSFMCTLWVSIQQGPPLSSLSGCDHIHRAVIQLPNCLTSGLVQTFVKARAPS
jgi:hypothetical protein